MITMTLDWREVLWWMRGGMSGSHNCWGVYDDMVNIVWPMASEQERRNMFLVMRRDFGDYWRSDEWNGHSRLLDKGEGEWKPESEIFDKTPWMYFRQVLACFDPDNQWEVSMRVTSGKMLDNVLLSIPKARIVSRPTLPRIGKEEQWTSDTARVKVRTYLWKGEYRIDWDRRCAEDLIAKAERMEIPDNGTI